MYCGNCFRDNALVAALRQRGHPTLLVPLYLPLTLEEPDASAGVPIFFSGLNVYLEQKSPLFRSSPGWLHNLLAAPKLLERIAPFAAKTRPADVGDLTLSMLRGEQGNQARELADLISWLRTQPKPDAICLSNGLLIGLVRRLRAELGVPVACGLQGEDSFLDALPAHVRTEAWRTLGERAREADALIAPSQYFAARMADRLKLPPDRIRVVPNGINLDGFPATPPAPPDTGTAPAPVLGYFARMCPEKGLDTLVGAFIELKKRDRVKALTLRVGGGCGPGDEPFVQRQRERLSAQGLLGAAEFCPNLSRPAKLLFLRSLTVFSVPALYGEAFGLYVLEALAAGVPAVLPRHAAFPELIGATGGGILCEPGDAVALADALESLLLNPVAARGLGAAGHAAVHRHYSAATMANKLVELFGELAAARRPSPAPAPVGTA